MGTGRVLMVIAETLAVAAMAVQFVLPSEMGISITLGHRSLGLPIRWVVPLLLISIAGGISLTALFSMYWRLAQVATQTGQ
jgi:hypothetical protein